MTYEKKSEQVSTSSPPAQTKTPEKSLVQILGGCAYSDANRVLPLFIVIAAVEKFVKPLIDKV